MNPFRYRGYVYDVETGLYYLRSRYYNPAWGRFINADTVLGKVGALGTHNLFAYCANNPVMCVDPSGHVAWLVSFAIAAVIFLAGETAYAPATEEDIPEPSALDTWIHNNVDPLVDPLVDQVFDFAGQAIDTIATGWDAFWGNVADGGHTLMEMGIMSAQMDLHAYTPVWDWVCLNMGGGYDQYSNAIGLSSAFIEAGALLGLYSIPVAGQVLLLSWSFFSGFKYLIEEGTH